MTASAYDATSAAWSAFETPRPTPIGNEVAARVRATSSGATAEVCSRAPVTPITDAA
ncbi:hypothetical protein D3C83_246100 [compost metagenome]